MPSVDQFGLPVTTDSDSCIAAIDQYFHAVLAYQPFSAWGASDEAVAADSVCPLARILAADYAFCRGDVSSAKTHLEFLEGQDVASWTPREVLYAAAWRSWIEKGDPGSAHASLLKVVADHPKDLFAIKRGQIMAFNLGDGAKVLQVVQQSADVIAKMSGSLPRFFHGMWSFGLGQQGEYEEAEAKAREGLELAAELGEDVWLHHSMACALYFQGEERMDEAVEFLEAKCSQWSATDLHPFLYTQCWWYLALFRTERREYGKALQIFDSHLWAPEHVALRTDPQVQLSALGLLWRFETRGQKEAALLRWKKVLESCRGTTLSTATAKAPAEHADLLLDVCLVRALCVEPALASELEGFLNSIAVHAESMKTAAGDSIEARSRAETYEQICKNVAELFRTDKGMDPKREKKARMDLAALKFQWPSCGGSEEQRTILLEAVEGPVVCGEPEQNFDVLFQD